MLIVSEGGDEAVNGRRQQKSSRGKGGPRCKSTMDMLAKLVPTPPVGYRPSCPRNSGA